MSAPRVAIITPTWQRHSFLLDRCIPSVQAQGYLETEHLVISDGPDPDLERRLAQPWLDGWKNLWFRQLPEHDPGDHYGHHARAYGIEMTGADYIGYCDDDDALRPDHVHRLADALTANPGAGFAVSRMMSHGPHGESAIGHGPLACGNVGTPMIMHRREITAAATWDHAGQYEDWDLVLAWMNAGIEHVRVDAETVDVWPSAYR